MDRTRLLLPRPRRSARLAGVWRPGGRVRLMVDAPAADRGRLMRRGRHVLARSGLRVASSAADRASLVLDPSRLEALGREGYELTVEPAGARALAADARGLLHALSTLGQWLRLHDVAEVPSVRVEDRPSFAQRGVLLDISRDQVPTLATLEHIIDRLAGWKVNQLQLYMEHAFAYAGHERVWRGASPLTASQVRRLDAYCAERGIELVPNQNSFGHFHRWLVHAPYRALAECPDGVDHPFSRRREPFSLCATDPGSLALLADLYDQLLPCFRSRRLNVGLDETLDLGQCRTRAVCEARGKHRVYLDFVNRVSGLVRERGRSMQMWGDIALQNPDCVASLPDDTTVLAWGYEAAHPFDQQARQLESSGLPFLLCPGTSSWHAWAGRTHNAVLSLASAARAGHAHGAGGMLICDWGDHGHLQPWTASLAGLVAGAAFAWNADAARAPDDLPLADLLDRHAFAARENGLGKLVCDLGNAYRETGTRAFNGTPLFHLLTSAADPPSHDRYAGMGPDQLAMTARHVDRARDGLAGLPPGGDALARQELLWSTGMMRLATDLGQARLAAGPGRPIESLPSAARASLGHRLEHLVAERRHLWLARNRRGGLKNALADLRGTLRSLRDDRDL